MVYSTKAEQTEMALQVQAQAQPCQVVHRRGCTQPDHQPTVTIQHHRKPCLPHFQPQPHRRRPSRRIQIHHFQPPSLRPQQKHRHHRNRTHRYDPATILRAHFHFLQQSPPQQYQLPYSSPLYPTSSQSSWSSGLTTCPLLPQLSHGRS